MDRSSDPAETGAMTNLYRRASTRSWSPRCWLSSWPGSRGGWCPHGRCAVGGGRRPVALHLGRVVERAIASVGDEERVGVAVAVARDLVASLDELVAVRAVRRACCFPSRRAG